MSEKLIEDIINGPSQGKASFHLKRCTRCGFLDPYCICEANAGGIKADIFLSNREHEWLVFSGSVAEHIATYTISQYGDAPDDFMSTTSAKDVEQQIKKYAARFGSNARGFEEAQRDLLKIAHYCAILYNKRIKEKEKDNA